MKHQRSTYTLSRLLYFNEKEEKKKKEAICNTMRINKRPKKYEPYFFSWSTLFLKKKKKQGGGKRIVSALTPRSKEEKKKKQGHNFRIAGERDGKGGGAYNMLKGNIHTQTQTPAEKKS